MGRKPIKRDVRMKQVTLWLDPEVMEHVHERVGKQKVSEFVRTAVEEKLARDERVAPAVSSTPPKPESDA